ncbi:MAG TPA: hypothetical protein PLI05_00330 [Methanotrichaceae archaeon]|nr:hypothetical protein [Methanotrichaceae archaeon]HQF15496.1 hypothetical protein [Methanotrichaceae archaeon]HQI90231.1 hypothetical protein [Methanotrichaceae archaeon]HQJ27800.1 hypothetical protein [Methanotrichaceae archaeon]
MIIIIMNNSQKLLSGGIAGNLSGDGQLKAVYWHPWDSSATSKDRSSWKSMIQLRMKPWDQILPEDGFKERMGGTEPLWRPWYRKSCMK